MRRPSTVLTMLLVLAACGSKSPEERAAAGGDGDRASGFSLPFVSDDYGAALAQARERELPLFVETWAPW